MQKKIDLGEDKNFFINDPKSAEKLKLNFLEDDLAKTADDALNDAKKLVWDRWINSEPLIATHTDDEGKSYLFYTSEIIEKKVVLIEFWDYTLLQSKRSLSYLNEWHKRYSSAGLVIIGVHSPFFEFGKDKKFIQDACKEFGLNFPIVIDNQFEIWKTLDNRFWPRKILISADKKFQKDIIGEGKYSELETSIQLLLRELSPGLACPPLLKPLRKSDNPDFVDEGTTEEIFFSIKRKPKFGGTQLLKTINEEINFKEDHTGAYATGVIYLQGPWVQSQEGIFGATTNKDTIKISTNFTGTDIYLIARSKPKNILETPQAIRPQIFIDKKPLGEDKFAKDNSFNEYHKPVAVIKDPKMYHIATKLTPASHDLTLQIETNGNDTLEIFGLAFESQ